jgi:hypothetical protein
MENVTLASTVYNITITTTTNGDKMNKKEIAEKIKLYEADLEFCKEAGYKTIAVELQAKIKELNELLTVQNV